MDSASEEEVRNAVLAGNEVTVHSNPISVPGFTGAGYIILNPNTGLGAYKITGGSNGGFVDRVEY